MFTFVLSVGRERGGNARRREARRGSGRTRVARKDGSGGACTAGRVRAVLPPRPRPCSPSSARARTPVGLPGWLRRRRRRAGSAHWGPKSPRPRPRPVLEVTLFGPPTAEGSAREEAENPTWLGVGDGFRHRGVASKRFPRPYIWNVILEHFFPP